MVWLALLISAEAATPYFGIEWRPLSRQDLVWVDEGRTSGTSVGELDGTIRPVVSAFGGVWFNRWVGAHVGIGLAQLVTTTKADDIYVESRIGVVRPSLDLRFGWAEQGLHRPVPWFMLGGWADIPTVREVSNGWTTEEQEQADLDAKEDRYRLGGGGGRVGFGVDYRLLPGLMLGVQATVGLQRMAFVGTADTTVSLWIATEGALTLTFEWPPGGVGPKGRRHGSLLEVPAPPETRDAAEVGGDPDARL